MRLKSIGEFGLILRDVRKSRLLTQTQLAERVGTNQKWISNLETGRIENPGLATILRACEALDIGLIAEIRPGTLADDPFEAERQALD
jgi:transcriptional regulator with XRE-family HTH domain